MKPTTQVRVDKFKSMGALCRIVGRKDHVVSTEKYIKRSYIIRAKVRAEQENGYTFSRTDPYWRPHDERLGHVPLEYYDAENHIRETTFEFNEYPINRSIERLLFRPLTSQNSLDCRPADQVSLLPYLCESEGRQNMQIEAKQERPSVGFDTERGSKQDNFVVNDFPYLYYPDESGVFFITFTYTDADADEDVILQRTVPQEYGGDSYLYGTRFVNTAGADNDDGTLGIPFVEEMEYLDDSRVNHEQENFSQCHGVR